MENRRNFKHTVIDGAAPDCPGHIQVDVDHHQGGWTSACDVDVELMCAGPRCWWSVQEWDGAVDLDLLQAAQEDHEAAKGRLP